MTTIAIVAVCVLAGCWILISVAGSGPILAMEHVAIEPLADRETEDLIVRVISTGAIDTHWLSQNEFAPLGAYQVEKMPGIGGIVVWKKAQERTYLCAYSLATGQISIDFVTVFERGLLTTGKSKDSQLLPIPPESHVQSFTATTAVLYRHHLDGLRTLAAMKNVFPLAVDGNFEEDFTGALSQQSKHIRSLALWPLRIPWWYFVRRSRRHDKTLTQLERTNVR